MWMDEEDAHLEEQNSNGLVDKFNSMLKDSSSVYFDVDQLEVIIDHYLERSKPEEALKAVEHGLSIFEKNNFLRLRKGQILVSMGDFENGKSILNQLLESDPYNQEILFGLGMAYAQVREPKRAISYYKRAFDYADQDLKVEVLVELALQYQLVNEVENSLKCYKKAFELGVNTDVVLREFASCVRRNQLFLEGVQTLEEYLDEHPYSHSGWFHLGMLYFDHQLIEKAIECYDFALVIKEDFALGYYKKAEALIKLDKHRDALEALHEELKYREPMALNYCIIADCYESLSDYDRAEEYYKKAIDLDNYFSEAHIGLGFLKEVQSDFKGAVPYYERAVSLEPDNYNAHLMLSNALIELGKYDDAKAVVLNLLSVEEGVEEAWIELASIYVIQEDLERAIQTIDEGIETAFSNEQLWLKKVVYLHKIGKRSEALDLARELLSEDHTVKEALSACDIEILKDPDFVLLLSEF